MSKRFVVSAFLCSALVFACGTSGSGVSGSKLLVSLSDGEITDLCEYFADLEGPERTIQCGGGVTMTVGGGSVAECVTDFQESQDASPNCTATVSNAEACAEAFADFSDAELCSDNTPLPAACAPLLQCGGI